MSAKPSNTPTTQLLFTLADILNTNIYMMSEKDYRAAVTKEFKIGPWVVSSDVTMACDEVSDKLVTAFIRLRKSLWAYAVVTADGQWLLMFDNDHAKIRVGGEREFGTGSGLAAMRKLKPAITGALAFVRPDNKWVACDPQELISDV